MSVMFFMNNNLNSAIQKPMIKQLGFITSSYHCIRNLYNVEVKVKMKVYTLESHHTFYVTTQLTKFCPDKAAFC